MQKRGTPFLKSRSVIFRAMLGGFTLFVLIFNFIPPVQAQSTQVSIDNFNVVQSSIPRTASSVDFRLSISQQDPNLSCAGGYLDWVVFSSPGISGYPRWVRSYSTDARKSTDLPLSPNPLSLDFNEPNFIPGAQEASNGYIFFRAALGCNIGAGNSIYSSLAVSAPICVTIPGGSGNCSVTNGRGINVNAFDLNPKLICSVPRTPANYAMTLRITVDKAQLQTTCGTGTDQVYWCVGWDRNNTLDECVYPANITTSYTLRTSGPQLYSEDLSQTISFSIPNSLIDPNGSNLYVAFYCPNPTGYSFFPITHTQPSPVNIKHDPNATGSVCNQQPPIIGGGRGVSLRWSIDNPLFGKPTNIFGVIFLISDWILNIAGGLVVLMIIYAGVRFMISRGNPGEIQGAKAILKWSLAGLAIILIGKGFIFIVEAVLSGQIPQFFP